MLTSLAGKCHKSNPLKNIRSIPCMNTACFEPFVKWKNTEIICFLDFKLSPCSVCCLLSFG